MELSRRTGVTENEMPTVSLNPKPQGP